MLSAFIKGINQLGDKNTRKYVWLSLLAALITFAILWSAIAWLLANTAISQMGWLEGIIDVLGGIATLALTWFLFPATVSAVIGLFLENVAECVERTHYPELPTAEGQPIGEAIVTALRFFAILIGLNILLLPFLFLGPVFPVVFYLVNGYLLGREYFEMVAARRLPAAEMARLRKERQTGIVAAGVGIAFLLTIPLVNLLMPVVATAVMVHLFEKWRPGGAAQPPARV